MTWTEALMIVLARTRHERYRALCADGHPERDGYRALMIRLAEEPAREGPDGEAAALPDDCGDGDGNPPGRGARDARLLRRAQDCPYREGGGKCGCQGRRAWCGRAGPDGRVTSKDCLLCMRECHEGAAR